MPRLQSTHIQAVLLRRPVHLSTHGSALAKAEYLQRDCRLRWCTTHPAQTCCQAMTPRHTSLRLYRVATLLLSLQLQHWASFAALTTQNCRPVLPQLTKQHEVSIRSGANSLGHLPCTVQRWRCVLAEASPGWSPYTCQAQPLQCLQKQVHQNQPKGLHLYPGGCWPLLLCSGSRHFTQFTAPHGASGWHRAVQIQATKASTGHNPVSAESSRC